MTMANAECQAGSWIARAALLVLGEVELHRQARLPQNQFDRMRIHQREWGPQ